MRTPLSIAAALVALAATSLAHNIQMGAHSRECFHEQLHKDDKMTVTFQVGDREFGGAGSLEIDFWVRHPSLSPADLPLGDDFTTTGFSPVKSARHILYFGGVCFWASNGNDTISFRSSTPQARTSSTSAASPPATTASTPTKTANLNTALAMSTGLRVARK